MKNYADTNFFTAVFADIDSTATATSLFDELRRRGELLPVTRLLRMEYTNAMERLVFESRRGQQGLRVTPENALLARASFDDILEDGNVLQWTALPEDELERTFETLAYRHTAKEGFRTYDLLHVASALLLGCDAFWSFDKKACRLARLEGLRTF